MDRAHLTLFTTPKPFRGRAEVLQRNALTSWILLHPRPEVILLDDVDGAAAVAAALGIRHLPDVERNTFGTPLVRSVFTRGQQHAAAPIVCYVNADVILLQDFVDTLDRILAWSQGRAFVAVGRRWNLPVEGPLALDGPDWSRRLRARLAAESWRESPAASDYFAFPRSIHWEIPDFAIGRGAWDGWFLYNAHRKGVPIIDASACVTAIHQQHDYSHWAGGGRNYARDPEFQTNKRLRGGFWHQYSILDATVRFTASGHDATPPAAWLSAWVLRLRLAVAEWLKAGEPFTLPILWPLRLGRIALMRVGRLRQPE